MNLLRISAPAPPLSPPPRWRQPANAPSLAADRASRLKVSLGALQLAGREFRKVAGLHVSKFVEQNSALARAAGKDVSALARSTYQQFAQEQVQPKPARKARKTGAQARTTRSRRASKTV